jgi:hypothetical protein
MGSKHKRPGQRGHLWATYRSRKRARMFPDGPFHTVLAAMSVSFIGILYGVHRIVSGTAYDAIPGVAIVLASLLAMGVTILYLLLPVEDGDDD